MSGKKSNPYRTTGKPEKSNEPVVSPSPPARKFASHRRIPGTMATVGGKQMKVEDMEFGTEDDVPTNVQRNLVDEPDIEVQQSKPAAVTPDDESSKQPSIFAQSEASSKPASASQSASQSLPGAEAIQPSTRQTTGQSTRHVTAVLVDEDEEERRIEERLAEERKDIPMAEPVKEVPWWRRQSTIFAGCIVLLIVIIVAITVPLTRQSPVPAVPPTISPAPTALTVITVVLQLDDKPWETGWTLTCDEEIIQDAPPGTYGLLAGRPNFRMEYPTEVTVGADCELTIVDTGGDGMNPGFIEIYNGQGVGSASDLITRGALSGPEVTLSFMPGSTAPPTPTAAPSIQAPTASNCTVCPDGEPVPFKDADAQGWGMTCEQLEVLASITTNPAICRNMQDQAAFGCGCRNFCTTMCADGSEPDPANADDIVFVQFDQQVTCGELQEDVENARANSQDQCLSANFLGEDVCGCPPTGPFCRICEGADGNTNPGDDKLLTEVVPGVNCLDITGIAYTLKRDDPRTGFFQLCPACLSIGAYCGCDVPADGREFCRLCGDKRTLLPQPDRLVNSTIFNYTTTCYDVEFRSNINDNSTTLPCQDYREDAAEVCCASE